jgi:hypothetical protein
MLKGRNLIIPTTAAGQTNPALQTQTILPSPSAKSSLKTGHPESANSLPASRFFSPACMTM